VTPDAPPRLGKAVQDGVLRYVSPSQLTTASEDQDGGCLRKWWFDKVGGMKAPETASQALGTEVHAELEHYLRTGEDVLGRIARAARPHLPPPGSVEPELAFGSRPNPSAPADDLTDDLVVGGVPVVGRIDVWNPAGLAENEGAWTPTTIPEVLDWKTSKDPERHAKSGTALVRTVQMPVYAAVAFALAKRAGRQVDAVRTSHVTLATKGAPRAPKSSVVFQRLTVDARLFTISNTVDRMRAAARETDPNRVAYNADSCTAYGGCPFWDACPKPAIVALRTALGGKTESLMGLLDDLTSITPATPPPAKPAPAVKHRGLRPGIDPRPADLTLDEKRAWLVAQQEHELAALEAEANSPPPAPAPAKRATIRAKDAKQNAGYLVPFSTGPIAVTYIARTTGGFSFAKADGNGVMLLQAEDELYVGDAVVAPDAPAPGVSGPVATPIPPTDVVPEAIRKAADAVAPPAPAAPEKPKRSRKKADTAPASATETLPSPVPTIAPSTPPVEAPVDPGPVAEEPVDPDARPEPTAKAAAYVPSTQPGYTLLINAAHVTGTQRSAADLIEIAHQAIREQYKCTDCRTASADALGFGRWKGVLGALVVEVARRQGLAGYVHVDTSGELGAVAAEALAPGANVVIRGL